MRLAAIVLVALAACSSPVGSHTNASPLESASAPRSGSSSPSGAPVGSGQGAYAVVMRDFFAGGSTYTVSLVAADGHVAASASPRKRTNFAQISNLSTTLTALYYLDGDTDIHYLRPDGSTGLATTVPLAANQVVAFAVSPDDRRIAVSILDFTKYPVGTRLYVEDVTGHTNHVELFASPTVEEWPAGWHNGRLVMALGLNRPPQNAYEGFLTGHGYHVADANSGNRLLSLCDGGDGLGPESPAGFVCETFPNASIFSWDGQMRPAVMDGLCPVVGPLSPTGVMVSNFSLVGGGCSTSQTTFLLMPDGQRGSQTWDIAGRPAGWIDPGHFVAVGEPPRDGPDTATPIWIVDVRSAIVLPTKATGFFAAALPGGL